MMKFLEFLEEGDGAFSATRLGLLLWVVGVLVVWIVGNIRGVPTPIDNIVATILGILMTGKVVQKFGEDKAKPPGPAPADPGASARPLPVPTPAPVPAH